MHDRPKKLNQPRATAPVNSKLDKALVAYMAAAAAAMFTASAQAKVVYTPANSQTSFGSIPIDLNNDGVVDFTISVIGGSFHSELTVVKPQIAGNAVLAAAKGGVAAGFFGVAVGPGEKFLSNSFYSSGRGLPMADAGMYGGSSWFNGAFANATNRYIGMKFVINGTVHYGWARVNVSNYLKGGALQLTGYAYETTPQTNIIEGHVSGPEKASNEPPALLLPTTQLANLGLLARGADGIAFWRRDSEMLADERSKA
jgi:hypothetical protein